MRKKEDLMGKCQKWRFTIALFSIDITRITILSIWESSSKCKLVDH